MNSTLERKINAPKDMTSLRINNHSNKILYNTVWNSVAFIKNHNNSIEQGYYVTNSVDSGNGPIFFWFYDANNKLIHARTSQQIFVLKDQQEEYTFNVYTYIIEINNPDISTNSGQLGTFISVKE